MAMPIRVLVVDDSAFIRYTIIKHLEADPEIDVVGSARDGIDALEKIATLHPDVVTLDVEMPRMDGLAALQQIMKDHPTPVLMLSSLTKRGAQVTVQALLQGAVDFIQKPTTSTDVRTVIEDLSVKVKAAARIGVLDPKRNFVSANLVSKRPADCSAKYSDRQISGEISESSFRAGDPVIVIGASTGGPRALQEVLSSFPTGFKAAILIVQHMPAGFTRSLAQRLNEASKITIEEAKDGDCLELGTAVIAPGDYHMRLKDARTISLDQGARCNHVRPAVDVTLESVVKYHNSAAITVILTGMGTDGTQGARLAKLAGGKVIVEHESTSIIYGMPRSVVEAQLADEVLPLQDIGARLEKLVNNEWK
jgi:two-component system chemotaxis response regulator CheB